MVRRTAETLADTAVRPAADGGMVDKAEHIAKTTRKVNREATRPRWFRDL